MKAQISTEYLIILGIAIAAILPAGYFFYTYSTASNDKTIRGQVENIGNQMLVNAESIYGLSDGSLVTLDVKFPENIRDIYILEEKDLVISYELSSGITESVFFSKIPLSGNYTYPDKSSGTLPITNSTFTDANANITQGKRSFRFESKTSYVMVLLQ